MGHIVTHMGAWAPRAEQVATAKLLSNVEAVSRFIGRMRTEAAVRLEALYTGLREMREAGLPVDCVRPQGAIYVSAQFALHGRRAANGSRLETDDDVRRYLLTEAGVAAIPFNAFGAQGGDGWFRLSIGVVSVAEIRESLTRVRQAIERLST